MMLSDRLTKVFARVVLAAYTTHLFAPLVQASEEVLTDRPINHLGGSLSLGKEALREEAGKAHLLVRTDSGVLLQKKERTPLLSSSSYRAAPSFLSSLSEEALENLLKTQSETYQYRLHIKTSNSQKEKFQLKVSRKIKESDSSFEKLHTANVAQRKIEATSSQTAGARDDILLALFQRAVVGKKKDMADSLVCSIPGLATLRLKQDGSVSFDQAAASYFSAYDLVLKTSASLTLQALAVEALTLHSPKTVIEAVATNRLHMDHAVTNEGGLRVKQITGRGTLINHATLNLEGTTENPAILGVRKVINEKEGYKEAKIEAPHLQITSENESFLNGEGTEFKVSEKLTENAPSTTTASFINRGSVHLRQATLNRETSNAGFWQAHQMTVNEKPFTNKNFGTLNILDQLTVNSVLMNEGDLTVKNLFKVEEGVNKGTIKAGHTWLSGDRSHFDITSTGILVTNFFTSSASDLNNRGNVTVNEVMSVKEFTNSEDSKLTVNKLRIQKDGKFINTSKSTVTIKKELEADGCVFQNEGTLKTQGNYSQKSGEFINTGSWYHTGDIDLGSTILRNNKGTMNWQNGTWTFLPQEHSNHGIWVLDRMECSLPLTIHNYLTLHLKNSKLTFNQLMNHQNLILSGGQYTVARGFINNHLISFLENDWTFTEDEANTAPHRFVLKGYDIKDDIAKGEIESEKNLNYDLQALPKLIRSRGEVSFSKRHSSKRTLADLEKVSALGKVSFYCPAITTIQDYEFGNIGHLALYVDGLFTTHHSFIAPALTLEVDGPFTCGASNAVMGTVAGTEGPLTVTAHNIDGRFAQMYGAGPTLLKSTQGDILVGASVPGVDPEFKEFYIATRAPLVLDPGVYDDYWQAYHWKYYNECHYLNKALKGNGAYFASKSRITIDSANNIIADCGVVFGGQGMDLMATKIIQNIAGKFYSIGSTRIQGSEYEHSAKTPEKLHDVLEYPNEWRQYPRSGPAILSSLGDIDFCVQKVLNRGSTILSQGDFLSNGIPSSKDGKNENLSSYTAESMQCYKYFSGNTYVMFSIPCILQSGQSIQINTDFGVVSGIMNAPDITIQTTKDLLIYGSNGSAIVLPPQTMLFNLSQNTESLARGMGFLPITQDGGVTSDFPMGAPHVRNTKILTLGAQRPMNPALIFNPIGNLSSGLYNLFIQSTLSKVIGKVHLRGGHGKPLASILEGNAAEYCDNTGSDTVTLAQTKTLKDAMILYKFEPEGNLFRQLTYLAFPPSEFNDVPGLSGGKGTIHAGGNLTLQNAVMEFEKNTSITSEGKLRLLSLLKRVFTLNGHYDVIENGGARITSKEGTVTAVGKTGFEMKGVALRSMLGLIAGSTEGTTEIENILLQRLERHFHEEKDKDVWTTHVSTSSHASKLESQADKVTVISGENAKTRITGSHLKALLAIIFKGSEVETNASVGINTTTINTETNGFWSSSKSTSMQQSANLYPTVLEALEIYTDTKKKATYRGTDFIADVLYDNTEEGASFEPTIATLEYFQQMVNESAFAKTDVGCKGGYEVMQPCRWAVKKVVRQLDNDAQMTFNSVEWDKNRTEIIGKFAETTYQLKQWHTEWAIHEQLISDEALVVVALAIAIATQGAGAAWMQGLLNSTFGMVPGTVMVGGVATTGMVSAVTLTGTGAAMASAALTTLCTQAATSYLRTGDPIATAKVLCSKESLTSLGISIASAGLTQKIGTDLKLQLDPKKMGFLDYAKKNGLEFVIKAPLNSVIARQSVPDSLRDGSKSFVIDTIAQYSCNQIGKLYQNGQAGQQGGLTYFEQKFLHGIVGAGSGALFNLDNPLKGALSGGVGAVLSEVLAEHFVDLQTIKSEIRGEALEKGKILSSGEVDKRSEEVLKSRTNLVRIATASLVAMARLDPTTSIITTNNALDNNFIPSMTKSLLASEGLEYPEKDIKKEEFWQDEYRDSDDLYFERINEAGEDQRNYVLRSHVDEEIENIQEALKDKNLTVWEKVGLNRQLNMMLDLQAETKVTKSALTFITADIDLLTNSKRAQLVEIDHRMKANHNNMFDSNLSLWQRVGCGFMQESLSDYRQIISQGPETRLEVGLFALNFTPAMGPVVGKTVQLLNPKQLAIKLTNVGKGLAIYSRGGMAVNSRITVKVLDLTGMGKTTLRAQSPVGISAKILQKINLRGEAKFTDKIFSFTHNEQGAGRGLGESTALFKERALLPGDIAKKTDNLVVRGSISGDGKTITVKLDWVKNSSISNEDLAINMMNNHWSLNKPQKPLPTGFVETMMNQLTSTAKEIGATTLQLEALTINPRLSRILSKRYNAVDRFGNGLNKDVQHLFITIPLQTQSPPNTSAKILQKMNLRGEAKIIDKISSFIRDEKGAGRGFGKGDTPQLKSIKLSSSPTSIKDRKIEILIPCKSYEDARNKALRELGDINEATRKIYMGRMEYFKDKITGFETNAGGVHKRFRVDYEPEVGLHINVEIGKGTSRKKWAFLFPGTEKDIVKIIKRLERDQKR